MRSQNFGIEIEMTGLTRSAAARIIAGHFGTQATHVGGAYDAYTIRDEQNRQWKVVSDASIRCRNGSNRAASRDYSVEFVSPICQYEDIETVQELVRKLRTGGARVNDSCGIHVHVDASAHTPQTLRNIVNIMAAKEDLLYKTLQVKVNREHYCQKADTRFLEDLNHKRPKTMDEVEELWYNGRGGRYDHYDNSRYHALNAHKRGSGSQSAYKGNQDGSLPEYAFHWHGQSDCLYLFEAPIDLLSFLSLYKEDWQAHSYAAACGVSDQVLWQMMKDNPGIRRVCLCLDHDEPGQAAARRIAEKLKEHGIPSEILVPIQKDWNEDLLFSQQEEIRCPTLQL